MTKTLTLLSAMLCISLSATQADAPKNKLLEELCPKEAAVDASLTFPTLLKGATSFNKSISGKDSQVIVDAGERSFFEKVVDCGPGFGQTIIRYSKDTNGSELTPLQGYEVFFKYEDGRVVGVALDSKGDELAKVPESLANDKARSKGPGKDPIIRTRMGCFQCHGEEANVSLEYDIDGARTFWKGVKRIASPESQKSLKPTPPQQGTRSSKHRRTVPNSH